MLSQTFWYRLCLFLAIIGCTTVALSQQPLPEQKQFYSVKILKILDKKEIKLKGGKDGELFRLLVKLDKKIPADTGYIKFVDLKKTTFDIADYQPSDEKRLYETDVFYVYFDVLRSELKTLDDFTKALPLEAKVYLRRHRP